jgi:hypothetical protein
MGIDRKGENQEGKTLLQEDCDRVYAEIEWMEYGRA